MDKTAPNKNLTDKSARVPSAPADDHRDRHDRSPKVGGASDGLPKSSQHEQYFSDKLLDSAVDTVFLFDSATGTPIRWNKHFADVSGYTDEEISHMKAPDDFYTEADIPRVKKVISAALAEGSCKLVMSLVTKHGALIPFEYAATAIDTADGRALLLSIGRDLTEHKQAEELSQWFASFPTLNPMPVMEIDKEKGIVYVNPAAQRLFPDLESKQMDHPFVNGIMDCFTDLSYPTRANGEREVEAIGHWYVQTYSLVSPDHLRVYSRDITERKQAEEKVRESEVHLCRAELLGNFGNWRIDLGTRMVSSSEGAKTIYGTLDGELTFHQITEAPLPEYRAMLDEAMRRLVDEDKPYNVEFKIKRETDGAVVELHSIARYDKNAHIVFGVIQDVTERKEIEASLERSQALLSIAEEILKIGGWEFDVLTGHGEWTDGVNRIYDIDQSDTPGIPDAMSFFDEDDRPTLQKAFQNALEKGEPYALDLRFTNASGERLWVRTIGKPVVVDGKVTRIYGNIVDITERKQTEEALRESEEKYALAFQTAPYAIAITSVDSGEYLEVNDAFCSITGYSRHEVINRSSLALNLWVDPEDRKRITDELLGARKVFGYELPLRRKNGEILSVLFSADLITLNGEARILSSTNDITDRKKMEETLRESEASNKSLARYTRATLDGLSSHIAILGAQGEIEYVNKAWGDFADSNPPVHSNVSEGANYLLTCDNAQGVDADEARKAADGIRQVLSGQAEAFALEYPCHSPSVKRWFVMRVTRFPDSGQPRVIVAHENITERKQAEEALQSANEYLQTLVHSSPLVVIARDLDGNITRWNPAAQRLFGWSEEEILGHPLPSVPDDLLEQFASNTARVLQGETLRDVEMRRKTKTGETVFVNAAIAPLRGPTNEVIGSISMLSDVTERKALEYRLRQAQKLEVLGRLSAGLGHEFKNMLMGISGYAEVLQLRIKPNDPDYESINDLLTCVDRAAKLTNQIQAFGKPKPIEPTPVVVNQLLRELEHMLEKLLGEHIQLTMNLTTDECVISADRSQIEQVLVNLAINARDAMPSGGTFTMRTRHTTIHEHDIQGRSLVPGDYVMLRISDTGVGMDEETRDRAFEPFFSTKSKSDRTGQGLAVVYSTIMQHKGHIEISSKPNAGTVFRILLPCVECEVEAAEISTSTTPKHGAGTILLVEDEESVRTPCKMMLEGFGYSVICAANGEEAVDIFRSRADDIDLVVMDLIMPKSSGKHAWQEMHKIRPEVKVLFMSGHMSGSINKDLAPPPGTPLLKKPFPLRVLVETVNELLGYGSGTESTGV